MLLVLIVASLVALVLAPSVRLLERVMPARPGDPDASTSPASRSSPAIGFLLASPVATQITHFEHNLPEITRNANRDLANVQHFLNKHGINVHIQKQGQTALDTLQKNVLKRSGDIVSFSRDLLSSS